MEFATVPWLLLKSWNWADVMNAVEMLTLLTMEYWTMVEFAKASTGKYR
jgi:hypothetical protein